MTKKKNKPDENNRIFEFDNLFDLKKELKKQDRWAYKTFMPCFAEDEFGIIINFKGKRKYSYSIETHTKDKKQIILDFDKDGEVIGVEVLK